MREELSSATTKQQKAEQDREEAEMKIAEVRKILLLILKLSSTSQRQSVSTK